MPIEKAVKSVALTTETYEPMSVSRLKRDQIRRCAMPHGDSIVAYPFSSIYISVRSVEARTDAHEKHIQCVGYVDDGAVAMVSLCHFWYSGQDRSG